MNSKIEEIKKLAMEPNGIEGLGGSYYELNERKFAELIIKECISVMENYRTQAYAYDKYYDDEVPICDYKRTIKEHFGIE